MPHESWLATELCLTMFAAGLVIIAMVCGESEAQRRRNRT